ISTTANASLPMEARMGRASESNSLEDGNPREIVFIHGMFVTPKCWEAWETYFRNRGYQVSSPAWPLHDHPIESLRDRSSEEFRQLGQLTLGEVIESYRRILRAKATKPILIGHSMGGLIAQILLSEGLGAAAVAIDSAPPEGIFVLKWSFLRSNWGA